MSKNNLTEGKVRAETNEGVFTPQLASYVLRSNCPSLPVKLDYSHLLTAVPMRSRATFVELLCGCLISPEGWVTRAISALVRGRHWTTYYKLLERGSVRTLRLARALFEVVNNALPTEALSLVIDDTLIPRQSEKAPGSTIRHDHAKKSNRPQFLLAQC